MAERRILQIMPGDGWAAVLDEDGEEVIAPLVGWALVQDGESTAVVGLVARDRVELVDTQPTFSRYVLMTDLEPDDLDGVGDSDYDDDDLNMEADDQPYDPRSGLLN